MKRNAVVVRTCACARITVAARTARPPVPLTSGIEAIKWRCIDVSVCVLHVAVRAVKATG